MFRAGTNCFLRFHVPDQNDRTRSVSSIGFHKLHIFDELIIITTLNRLYVTIFMYRLRTRAYNITYARFRFTKNCVVEKNRRPIEILNSYRLLNGLANLTDCTWTIIRLRRVTTLCFTPFFNSTG